LLVHHRAIAASCFLGTVDRGNREIGNITCPISLC
jgi:hypothetical protein